MSGHSKKDILKQTKLFYSGPNKMCSKQEVYNILLRYSKLGMFLQINSVYQSLLKYIRYV